MEHISIKELKVLLDDTGNDKIVVIDVRSEGEFSEMRIHDERVINIPVNQILAIGPETYGAKEVYLICNSGGRSSTAQVLLKNNGVKTINVQGGMMSWMRECFDVVSDNN